MQTMADLLARWTGPQPEPEAVVVETREPRERLEQAPATIQG